MPRPAARTVAAAGQQTHKKDSDGTETRCDYAVAGAPLTPTAPPHVEPPSTTFYAPPLPLPQESPTHRALAAPPPPATGPPALLI